MARKGGISSAGSSGRDRRLYGQTSDAYRIGTKFQEPTYCPECGAVYTKGRWIWAEKPKKAHEAVCPACQRLRDRYPAGVVSLAGAFYSSHRQEIVNLIRNEEGKMKAEHPLHRIIEMEEEGEGLSIATSDTHLPRRIGEALKNAYKGDLAFTYSDGERFVRVNWCR